MKTKIKHLSPKRKLGILTDIAERHDGSLTPEIVLDEASQKGHPLHSCFEWNNSKAAHQYRLQQAAFLIRTVKIKVQVNENESAWVRALVNIKPENHEEPDAEIDESGDVAIEGRVTGKGFYVPLKEALSHPIYKEQLMDAAKRDLAAFRNKYSTLSQLSGLIEKIDEFLEVAL